MTLPWKLALGSAGSAPSRSNPSNDAWPRSTAELAKTNEQPADREAEAAPRKADEVLRLSAMQRLEDLTAEADRLWPAHPQDIARYEAWLARAGALMAELPGHETKLAELRSQSVPWTAEEQAQHRAEHPRLPELERAQRELEYTTRLRSVLESGKPAAEVGLDLTSLPASAQDVNSLAWPLIDPERAEFGGERKGLVLARRAVELAAALTAAERAGIRNSLAWALFADGRFDEELAEEEQALEEAGTDEKKHFEEARTIAP